MRCSCSVFFRIFETVFCGRREMLSLPNERLYRSVEKHNSDLALFADRIEAAVIFDQLEVSSTEIVDLLIEGQIYDSQDFAREFVANAYDEIRRRIALYQSSTG